MKKWLWRKMSLLNSLFSLMLSSLSMSRRLPNKCNKSFPDDEYQMICQLLTRKINEFCSAMVSQPTETEFIDQKLKEMTEVIMNEVNYPLKIFNDDNLLLCIEAFFQMSSEVEYVEDALLFLSKVLFTTSGSSQYFEKLLPLIMNYANPSFPEYLTKNLFIFLTNFLADVKERHLEKVINDFVNYFPVLLKCFVNKKMESEYLHFIMVLSPCISPDNSQIYISFISYISDLVFQDEVINNQRFTYLILWAIYENISNFTAEFASYLNKTKAISNILWLIHSSNDKCIEPILAILFLTIKEAKDVTFITISDLEIISQLSFSSNGPIQFEALQLLTLLVQYFPRELLDMGLTNLFDIFHEVEYRATKFIFEIACFLINAINIEQYISTQLIKSLMFFILNNIESDEERTLIGISALFQFRESMKILKQENAYDAIFEESNGSQILGNLRDIENDDLQILLDKYESSLS
ncbi:hypothetical protein TRFO_24088 [Tritrichomonas foetus]|uniref:Uncharacterized protein n=1 Tax=Tritrichomonas foetus TaxID=1144522 RepID=A0A1J4KDG6_9EUKA|nr:hypothetical protein TRFO_24088 [Tritrichomonas foetus]|eukprot:OHT07670.1 hypothetical protein TRFO_24088 [Tritrichomonas foetus]